MRFVLIRYINKGGLMVLAMQLVSGQQMSTSLRLLSPHGRSSTDGNEILHANSSREPSDSNSGAQERMAKLLPVYAAWHQPWNSRGVALRSNIKNILGMGKI
jgi:hypothetical protein